MARRIVLVTGGSSGIGRAAALAFAEKGDAVAVLSQDAGRLRQVAEEIRAGGGEAMAVAADVADPDQVETAVRTVRDQWERIDVLVNNAGYLVFGRVEDCTLEDFLRQVSVNYLGAVYCTKVVLPLMRQQRCGAIVTVSSISGRICLPFNAAYQASKAALRAFTLTLRRELVGTGIGVTLITPGRTRTEIIRNAVQRNADRGRPLLGEMPAVQVARMVVLCAGQPRREVVLPPTLRSLLFAYAVWPDAVERGLPWLQAQWARWARQ